MNISNIMTIENKKNEIDIVEIADIKEGKKYRVSLNSDGRANIFFKCLKANGFSKRLNTIAQITSGKFLTVIDIPFDGKLQIEVHDPNTSEGDTWHRFNNITVEEV